MVEFSAQPLVQDGIYVLHLLDIPYLLKLLKRVQSQFVDPAHEFVRILKPCLYYLKCLQIEQNVLVLGVANVS